jgi:hypothetical protein
MAVKVRKGKLNSEYLSFYFPPLKLKKQTQWKS